VTTASVEPFTLAVPQAELDELARRLAATRWPERETVEDWSQGVPLEHMQALVAHWRSGYDWRRCESMLNGFGQFRTRIDGLDIHFLHVRSPHAEALPLLLTHGWPGSVVEFHKVIGPLTQPLAHGGRPQDAFHLVVPSLPGYGFSGKPASAGWGVERIASAWAELMARLGYRRYVAQGGDWGAVVTTLMAAAQPQGLAGIHLNMPLVTPSGPYENLSAEEQAALAAFARYEAEESGYARQQSTRPQTLGYALTDSPVGQAAWIYEKFRAWTDCGGDPRNVLTLDELLDNIMLYWLPGTAASSARLYWESLRAFRTTRVEIPVGCSNFPHELVRAPRSWAERVYPQLIHWNDLPRGGHFAAFEQPAVFVDELRTCFARLRP
jgi:epoxide hydrolase